VVAAIVLVMAAILFFARLGARALWASEFRWAEIAREMMVTGNYFWPTIDGRVYYDKPLGSYWLVLMATPFTGGLNEAAARVPCVIAGLGAIALLMLLTRRLYDSRTGVLAGFILATSFSFVFFSRHASADVETLTGELGALLLFHHHEERQDGWWVVGLWVVMALTSLTKGLLGFVLPILVIGSYCSLRNGWAVLGDGLLKGSLARRINWVIENNRWLFNWKSIVAIAVGAAIYSLPFQISNLIMGSDKGLAMVYRENVVRFFHPFDHRGPVYLYVYVIFALMAPWSVLLPAALVETHHLRGEQAEPARSDRFALVYFWATFVFYTLSGSRRSYYLLPILPGAAMLVARTLAYPGELRSKIAAFLIKFGYGLIAAASAASIWMTMPPQHLLPGHLALLPPAPARAVIVVLWMISVASALYVIGKITPRRIAISTSIIAYLAMVYIFIFAMPAADAYRGEKPFGLRVLQETGGKTDQIVFYNTLGPLFYLNPPKPIPIYAHKDDLSKAVAQNNVGWLITRRRDLEDMSFPVQVVLTEQTFPWEQEPELRNKDVLVKVGPPSK